MVAPILTPPLWRLVTAALVAPLVVPLILGVVLLVDGQTGDQWAWAVVVVGTLSAVLASLLIGLPLVVLLRRNGRLDAMTLCVSGFMAGVFVLWGVEWLLGGGRNAKDDVLWYMGLGGGLGLAVAVAFCLLAWIPLRRFARRRGPGGE